MTEYLLEIIVAVVSSLSGTVLGYFIALSKIGKKVNKSIEDFNAFVQSKRELDQEQDNKIEALDKKVNRQAAENADRLALLEKELLNVLQTQSVAIAQMQKDIEYLRLNYKP